MSVQYSLAERTEPWALLWSEEGDVLVAAWEDSLYDWNVLLLRRSVGFLEHDFGHIAR